MGYDSYIFDRVRSYTQVSDEQLLRDMESATAVEAVYHSAFYNLATKDAQPTYGMKAKVRWPQMNLMWPHSFFFFQWSPAYLWNELSADDDGYNLNFI